jgi:3-deoxy-manno-octulosonate cytidylyltransferase (CMP-KDO synthetase)
VVNQAGEALYFSRQAIPSNGPWRVHVGLYAFAAHSLPRIARLGPSLLEQSERLEQLRWLEAGLRIGVVPLGPSEAGVDTPEDLLRVRERWAAAQSTF